MSSKVLSERRNVYPVKAQPVVVPGYELTFDMAGLPYWEPGFGTIQPVAEDNLNLEHMPLLRTSSSDTVSAETGMKKSSMLHCVAFLITSQELDHIINTEGGSGNPEFGYRLVSIACKTYSGEPLVGKTLVNTQVLAIGLLPSPRYLNILIDGATEHNLAPEYISRLQSVTPYTAKTPGQKLAKYLMLVLAFPAFVPTLAFALAALAFDIKTPRIIGTYNEWLTRAIWGAHNWIFAPIFGRGC
ncbi:hypothetical protein LPJ78_005601 [Coemansia sp. RSA 989]|nr:hypothetical protein LPJ78_005601 [Coemansia sp. RSA 989]KAJ1870721.1 hypothetical protein LPJ55_004433 [Coemansia sp. RSA 990]KAJ2668283.1 hypothetical protein IWW42_005301 [Coemansia sp. RSA 1085]